MRLRRFKPNPGRLRVAGLVLLSIGLVFLILSTVFPFPEGTGGFLSIGMGQKASANPSFTARTETYVDVSSLSDPFDFTVTKPTGTSDGDILFCWLGWYAAVTVDSVPAGWTLLAEYLDNTDRYAIYWKVASSEGASWDWSLTGTTKLYVVCSCYTGGDFDAGDPIDVVSNTGYRTFDTSCIAADMSVAAANSPLVFWASTYAATAKTFTKPTTPSDTWVEDDDAGSGTSRFWTEVCSMIWSGSGATGDMTATISASATLKHAFAVALNPAAGGEPSISNTPSSKGFGILEVGTSATTGFEYFTITNNGTVTVDVTIQGTHATGGIDDVWTLSDTATPDTNTYGLKASTDSETLYQNYITGDDGAIGIAECTWAAQTFTPSTSHTITSVQLLLYRSDGSVGDVLVSITATSAGKPTGEDLCSGVTDGDTLTTSSSGEWRTITFDAVATLDASTQYALVVSAPDTDEAIYVWWRHDISSPTYSGGTQVRSWDCGSDWTIYSDTDSMFKEYGGIFNTIVKYTATYNTLVSDLAINATQDWGLLILMPTALTGYDAQQMSATITLVASAS